MTNSFIHIDNKLLKYYLEGYEKGQDDALRGLKMKLMSKTLGMRYEHLKEWERGYRDGYLAVNN